MIETCEVKSTSPDNMEVDEKKVELNELEKPEEKLTSLSPSPPVAAAVSALAATTTTTTTIATAATTTTTATVSVPTTTTAPATLITSAAPITTKATTTAAATITSTTSATIAGNQNVTQLLASSTSTLSSSSHTLDSSKTIKSVPLISSKTSDDANSTLSTLIPSSSSQNSDKGNIVTQSQPTSSSQSSIDDQNPASVPSPETSSNTSITTANDNVNSSTTNNSAAPKAITTLIFNPIKIMQWKDGIGALPGSNLKFKINDFGSLQLIDDEEAAKIAKAHLNFKSSSAKPVETVQTSTTESSNNNNNAVNTNVNSTSNSNSNNSTKDPTFITTNTSNNADNNNIVKSSNSANSNIDNNININNVAANIMVECVTCRVKGQKSNFIRNGRFCSQSCATKQSANLKIFNKSPGNVVKPDITRKRLFCKGGKMVVTNIGPAIQVRKWVSDRTDLGPNSRSETPDGLDLLDANEEVEDIDSLTGLIGSSKPFNWKDYLDKTKSFCAPLKCFKDNQTWPTDENAFKVGMKLEGIDPQHPSLYCVLTVAEVCGFRIRCNFDGYSDLYDFWINADSPFIFPAGWCQKTGRKLEPPKDMSSPFNWNNYLQMQKAQAAPSDLFTCIKPSYSLSQFRVGMKLEAVDKANTSLVCVASIADILDNYLLIHFDGWDDSYDYWTAMSSPYIHPINWCRERGKSLTPPKDYPKSSEKFKWETYLNETKSTAVPPKAFRLRQGNSFRPGMKLEVVDRRSPRFIRVATVVHRQSHSIKVHFDGWDDKYDCWIDDDSPDIHPVNWCAKTGHPLQPPLNYLRKSQELSSCSIPGCPGLGSTKSPKQWTHNKALYCPYSDENMDKELTDRLGRDLSDDELPLAKSPPGLESSCPPSPTSFSDMRRKRKRKRENSGSSDSNSAKISRPSTPSSSLFQSHIKNSNFSSTLSTLHQAIFSLRMNQHQMGEAPIGWEKHSKSLLSFAEKINAYEVLQWTPEKVAQFVATIPGCQDFGQAFEDELIDGEAFLLLNQTDLVAHLGIKLGPAVKIYNSILVIRDNIEA